LAAERALFSCNDRAFKKLYFSAKFAQDLGFMKTKIVSFLKELFLLSLLVLIVLSGFSLFSEHDLE